MPDWWREVSGCPGWCAVDHGVYAPHMSAIRRAGDIAVQLMRQAGVESVHLTHLGQGHDLAASCLAIHEAAGMAAILARLGHPQLAAAISACVDAYEYEQTFVRDLAKAGTS